VKIYLESTHLPTKTAKKQRLEKSYRKRNFKESIQPTDHTRSWMYG